MDEKVAWYTLDVEAASDNSELSEQTLKNKWMIPLTHLCAVRGKI